MAVTEAPFSERVRGVVAGACARVPQVLDGGRREFVVCGALTVVLIVLRSIVFTFYEETYFNSDQAIIGLMAKHVSEFRHFPLFYYGQNYLLAVQAWFLAPFFWLVPPSVASMRLPLVFLNIVAAVVLIRMLWRETNVRPGMAFIALLPFIIPPPFVAASLLDGNGCGAGELLLYVAGLWALRRRPLIFGAVLLVAYLHREFVLAVVPALFVVEVLDRTASPATTLRRWSQAALAFAAAWLVVDDLRFHLEGASIALQAKQLFGNNLSYGLWALPERLLYVFTDAFPFLLGWGRYKLTHVGISVSARAGSTPAASLILVALGLMIARLLWNRGKGWDRSASFPLFLLVAGLAMLFAYPLSAGVKIHTPPLVRYLHLALLVPTGIFALFMHLERRAGWRRAVAAAFALAATLNLVDTVSTLHAAQTRPLPGYHRQLATLLPLHGIRYARAGYWDSYVVDFLSREQVVVGSTGKVRIREYESAIHANRDRVAFISRVPCDGPIRQFPWCITRAEDKR